MPLLAAVLVLFVPAPIARELPAKALALAAGIAACAIAMWPVIRQTPATGNNLWHVAIIGVMPEYGTALGVEHSAYHFGVTGSDEYVELAVASYAKRMHPDWPPMPLSSAEYERGTRAYFSELLA